MKLSNAEGNIRLPTKVIYPQIKLHHQGIKWFVQKNISVYTS